MRRCWRSKLLLALGLAAIPLAVSAQQRSYSNAIEWYDSLGYPNAKDLPYVRVATGLWMQSGNAPPQNRFVEGFLLQQEADAFTVFLCSVPDLKQMFDNSDPYPSLTTVRFVRKTAAPAHQLVDYEVLDFKKSSSEVLSRVRTEAAKPGSGNLRAGYFISVRARIFAFARASLQKGIPEVAQVLMDTAANIPDNMGVARPEKLVDLLQQEIGDAVLSKAEEDSSEAPWPELLKTYDGFGKRFPASTKVAYAREAADALQKMIVEDATHRSKPFDQMSTTEQIAESIYQLKNLDVSFWIMNDRYPISTGNGKEKTPVHRLVDFGYEAVPQLIEALDDPRFTRSLEPRFNGLALPTALRVSDVAQRILQHISGRIFFEARTNDGRLANGTKRQQAEAWWAENQSKGEKQALFDQVAAGGQSSEQAVRKLVEKYPDVAIDAIRAGIAVAGNPFQRGALVALASELKGDDALAFLRSKLATGVEVPSQVAAAEALLKRGQPEAVPAMISVWRNIQPRLATNENDAYDEAGKIITFLAKSGDAAAIDALAGDIRRAPVDVRLAAVRVFLPRPRSAGMGATGKGVHVDADIVNLPGGAAGAAIERLLLSALSDTRQRLGMKGTYNEVSYEDPRICDMAALVLSKRWPEKYPFNWSPSVAERDAQIGAATRR